MVEVRPGASVSADALKALVREKLAGYKTPKSVIFVDAMGRAPNGKADYKAMKARAKQELGIA
jgi:fatty-acyl-CoA synthase